MFLKTCSICSEVFHQVCDRVAGGCFVGCFQPGAEVFEGHHVAAADEDLAHPLPADAEAGGEVGRGIVVDGGESINRKFVWKD